MTSPRQRVANRLNGLRSKGPSSEAGKLRSSINSKKHGLSSSIDDSELSVLIPEVAKLLEGDGYTSQIAFEIAQKIADFERNLDHQRQLFQKQGGVEFEKFIQKDPDDLEIQSDLELVLEANEEVPDKTAQKILKDYNKLICSLQARQAKVDKRNEAEAIDQADRYYRRAANQLIRQLKKST